MGIGSDKTYEGYKHRKPIYGERERLFMVQAIRYVSQAYINEGSGVMDFLPTLDIVKPDIFVVNTDGASEEKRAACQERGIEYVVLERLPAEGQTARSSTSLKTELGLNNAKCLLPTRLDLAGTWLDQPYVSAYGAGWALTVSLEPTFEIRERCGLSTSTRNVIKKVWPMKLPDIEPEMLARLSFCLENDPERNDGIVSGAQDAIGICVPGLCRHYYDKCYWPQKFEYCRDEQILSWLEEHLVMIPMEPRRPGCSVVEGMKLSTEGANALADAAERCWQAIMNMDLSHFAEAYRDSFSAQISMFPAMVPPHVAPIIEHWRQVPDVLAWKMPGAGAGGYLALVVQDAETFSSAHAEAIRLTIRRN